MLFALVWLGGTFSRAVAGQSADLTWTSSPGTNIVAYNVYYGTQSGFYMDFMSASDVSDVQVPGLSGGETYYFAVTAVDGDGNESAFSNEASYVVPITDPLELAVQPAPTSQAVELLWTPSTNQTVAAYFVYYGTDSGFYTDSSYFPDLTGATINGLEGGETYYFAVVAAYADGTESDLSNEASCVVPLPSPFSLQMQTYAGVDGQPDLIEINTTNAVSGNWELDSSPDLQNWTE